MTNKSEAMIWVAFMQSGLLTEKGSAADAATYADAAIAEFKKRFMCDTNTLLEWVRIGTVGSGNRF